MPEIVLTSENNEQFACDKCDRVFERQQQLIGHKASHANDGKRRQPCPECRKLYMPGTGMAAHRAKTHGVGGKSKQAVLRDKRAMVAAKLVKADPTLHADDILDGTLHTLYPNGMIPVHAVVLLMRWRDDTERCSGGLPMASSSIEERFADLDYPGRRKPVNRDRCPAPP